MTTTFRDRCADAAIIAIVALLAYLALTTPFVDVFTLDLHAPPSQLR